MQSLFAKLGGVIKDVDEETFDLFSQTFPSQDLGMIDPKAELLELSIAGRDFEISQSPGILQSTRGGGTTGAAIWNSSVRLAEWIEWPRNPLIQTGLLHQGSVILELGTGISGVVPLVLSPRVQKVIATDQSYVLKALRDNVRNNLPKSRKAKSGRKQENAEDNIVISPLDWETDDVASVLCSMGLDQGVDVVVACDCIFNYALIDPFVQTCVDICRLRPPGDKESDQRITPTVCLIVQQLRQPEVFEQWLEVFRRCFDVWRIPDDMLSDGLKENSGFAVHIGVPRSGTDQ